MKYFGIEKSFLFGLNLMKTQGDISCVSPSLIAYRHFFGVVNQNSLNVNAAPSNFQISYSLKITVE
jgi:hypothetical protein